MDVFRANPYLVLGVAEGAPPELIEAARRVAARRHHPDLAGRDDPRRGSLEREMAAINAAADSLLDACRRVEVDRRLRAERERVERERREKERRAWAAEVEARRPAEPPRYDPPPVRARDAVRPPTWSRESPAPPVVRSPGHERPMPRSQMAPRRSAHASLAASSVTLFVLRLVARAAVAAASSAAGSEVAEPCFAIGLIAALWLGVAAFFDPEDAGALVNFGGLFDTGVRLLVIALTPLVLVDVGRAVHCRRRILRLLARLAPAIRTSLRTVLGQV